MKSRAAIAWEANRPLEIEEVDLEGPKAGEVLVRIVTTSLCHTDVFTLSGRVFYVDLVGDDTAPRELPVATPAVDPRIDPAGDRVAYVHQGAVRVIDITDNGDEDRDRILVEPDGEHVTWGLADLVSAAKAPGLR